MKTVGIIAEYNPFHKGHEYHIKEAKQITGADCAVVVMNGNFMQRGEPAFTDKYTRTKMALAGGADMVFELPVCFGVSSAEDFAFGGVSLLNKLDFIDALCFGSEDGSISSLLPYAELFANEPPEYKSLLDGFLRQGNGFPAARQKAAEALLHTEGLADLSSPNNLLGIEYLKALKKLSSEIVPFTISRIGHGYHQTGGIDKADFPSASGIRAAYPNDSIYAGIPAPSTEFLTEALSHYRPLTLNDFSESLYYAIREHMDELDSFKDVTKELKNRIQNLLPEFKSAEQFATLLHTKQYTKGRMNRCLCHILLGIKKDVSMQTPLRLLGLNRNYSSLLKSRDDIIVKPAKAKEALSSDFFASDLYYHMVFKTSGYVIENEFHHSPILI